MAMQQPAAPGAQGGGENQFADLVSNLVDGMAMLSETMSGVNPEAAQGLDALSQQFQQIIAQAMSGAGNSPVQAQGQTSPEVGAAKAVPAGPQGMPRG